MQEIAFKKRIRKEVINNLFHFKNYEIMKKIIILFTLCIINLGWGQKLSLKYEFNYLKDSLDKYAVRQDVMRLLIDDDTSYYFSDLRYKGDSLLNIDKDRLSFEQLMLNKAKYNANKLGILVIKDKSNASVKVSNKILNKTYSYTEELKALKWNLTEEQENYLGYPVYKATTKFSGRTYIAWYTPEIPISEGPYKFFGLPGLILKINDTKNNFVFVCTEIKNEKDFSHYKELFSERKPIKISKRKYYKLEEESTKNFLKFVNRNTGVMVKPVNSSAIKNNNREQPYNPIEKY